MIFVFSVANNRLGPEGAKYLAEALNVNSSMKNAVGRYVTIEGTKREDINGRRGIAKELDPETGRFMVELLDTAQNFKFKLKNLAFEGAPVVSSSLNSLK